LIGLRLKMGGEGEEGNVVVGQRKRKWEEIEL
jgi:hypothetical protein